MRLFASFAAPADIQRGGRIGILVKINKAINLTACRYLTMSPLCYTFVVGLGLEQNAFQTVGASSASSASLLVKSSGKFGDPIAIAGIAMMIAEARMLIAIQHDRLEDVAVTLVNDPFIVIDEAVEQQQQFRAACRLRSSIRTRSDQFQPLKESA